MLILFMIGCSGNKIEPEENIVTEISSSTELTTIAGGCFWCIEASFEGIDGIISVISGYSGGKEKNPTYKQVSSGKTGHMESVQITYNPEVISYSEIIDVFWQQFDPTDAGGSFYDRGTQYQSAIFYHSKEQKEIALASKNRLQESGIFDKNIVTPVKEFDSFYPAEDYHQDYYKKDSVKYKSYRKGSGRDSFIAKYWNVPSSEKYPRPSLTQLKKQLTSLQYNVTMENGTEMSFNNEYNNNKEKGIYVCIVSGAPLFSSSEKFESGTGWPSFTKPIDARFLKKIADYSGGMTRVEVRSNYGDSHLGHLFYDGPAPTHLRYCMNSAAMKFIPANEMINKGYENYLWLVNLD